MKKILNKINPKYLKIIKILFRICFHYADLITDILLIVEIFEISAEH